MEDQLQEQGIAKVVAQPSGEETWEPHFGAELDGLLTREFQDNAEARNSVRQSTLSILGKCVDPRQQAEAERTGLIVGYVQSGKTLSFTAVTAAAHDNRFRVVVVVAGSTNILAEQSRDRLLRDLNIKGGPLRPWRHFHNPDTSQSSTVENLLEAWDAPNGRSQTVLITVLKHQKRIGDVAELLQRIPQNKLGAALVIDDEADQASLNNRVRQGQKSPVHRALLSLRDSLPNHAYLQYTATPQANIFIPLIDLLAPDFCEVLEPGDGYVGGRLLFAERGAELVETIPPADIQEELIEPPASLLSALRIFLLGVATGLIDHRESGSLKPQNRSMLVHPSRYTVDHTVHRTWLVSATKSWLGLLEADTDPDRSELVDQFKSTYDALSGTAELPSFDQIVEFLPAAIRETVVVAVNSLSEVSSWQDEWNQHYAWILVGGQKLDRGFTVEGLTVTYMPRGKGVGYSDTIQQRGRFFGYKRGYLDLCRIYLEPDVKRAFELYVESEESMRAFLRSNSSPGALKRPDLKRRFQMDRSLKPTRRSVLLDPPKHIDFRSGWFQQRKPHEDVERAMTNEAAVDRFVSEHGLVPQLADSQSKWLRDPSAAKLTHLHRVAAGVTIERLYEGLLTELVMSDDEDQQGWQEILALTEAMIIEHGQGEAGAALVWIRPDTATHRGTTKSGQISALFQGAYPDRKGAVYAGDSAVRRGKLTLHIHHPHLHAGAAKGGNKEAKWPRVPTIALWVDPIYTKDYIVQEQS